MYQKWETAADGSVFATVTVRKLFERLQIKN